MTEHEFRDPIPLNDLSRGWIATSPEVRAAIDRVLTSGQYVHGPEHTALESELAAFQNAEQVVAVASGTDALSLALLGVGCGPGSEVVTAANAGGYTSVAAARLGCGIAYADVDPTTLVMTAATVASAIGPSTNAVVITHLYGNVADAQGIVDLCRPRGIAVVEDCAQAFGAVTEHGRRVGNAGDAAALSFYPTKNLGAAGDGGAVVTSDQRIGESVRSLRQYGWAEKYVVEHERGMNSRLDEIQAAILRVGLRTLDDRTARRRSIVRRYTQALAGRSAKMVSGATPSSVAHLAVLRSGERDAIRDAMHAAGVSTGVHYPVPDHLQPGLPRAVRVTPLPETEHAVKEILTIPCFPEMTDLEVERVCDLLRRTARA